MDPPESTTISPLFQWCQIIFGFGLDVGERKRAEGEAAAFGGVGARSSATRDAKLQTEAFARLRYSLIVRDERERLESVGHGGLFM